MPMFIGNISESWNYQLFQEDRLQCQWLLEMCLSIDTFRSSILFSPSRATLDNQREDDNDDDDNLRCPLPQLHDNDDDIVNRYNLCPNYSTQNKTSGKKTELPFHKYPRLDVGTLILHYKSSSLQAS